MGMCLYAQLVETKNKQCKSAIIIIFLTLGRYIPEGFKKLKKVTYYYYYY